MTTSVRKLVLASIAALAGIETALADCGHPEVSVSGSEQEIEVACEAFRDVRDYFDALGFTYVGPLTISFEQEVLIGVGDDKFVPVLGCFDSQASTVEVTSWDGDTSGLRDPWGIEWSRGLATSIAHHELSHWATGVALGDDYARLPGPWHEFIAYSVQFELMDQSLRQRILANYADEIPFRTTSEVNEVLWAAAPDVFAVRSYLYQQKNGGSRLIGEIIRDAEDVGSRELPLLCR